jgi:hypothetical protein
MVRKIYTCKLISNAMLHNKDWILRMKVVYLSSSSWKLDLMLSSMDRDARNTSSDIGRIGNSFVFVGVLSST